MTSASTVNRGRELASSSYTTELASSRTHHLEGDFPGGTADLDFTLTLIDERIARLVIS